jgi:TRAP-type C4-dicarboxylate transport system permease small subunit
MPAVGGTDDRYLRGVAPHDTLVTWLAWFLVIIGIVSALLCFALGWDHAESAEVNAENRVETVRDGSTLLAWFGGGVVVLVVSVALATLLVLVRDMARTAERERRVEKPIPPQPAEAAPWESRT